jgi:hypothetical protein
MISEESIKIVPAFKASINEFVGHGDTREEALMDLRKNVVEHIEAIKADEEMDKQIEDRHKALEEQRLQEREDARAVYERQEALEEQRLKELIDNEEKMKLERERQERQKALNAQRRIDRENQRWRRL